MHPYAVDRMVEERQQELYRLSRAVAGGRPDRDRVGSWRHRAGTALASLGVVVGLPPTARAPARRSVAALFRLGPTDGC